MCEEENKKDLGRIAFEKDLNDYESRFISVSQEREIDDEDPHPILIQFCTKYESLRRHEIEVDNSFWTNADDLYDLGEWLIEVASNFRAVNTEAIEKPDITPITKKKVTKETK